MFRFAAVTQKPLIIPIFVPNMGCPNLCTFCNQKIVTGVSEPSLDDVERTVEEYLSFSKKRKRTEISFYGGSFTAIPKETMMAYISKGAEFVEKMTVDALRCSTRPDAVDEKTVKILKENHFETVELGVQTMSESLLVKMKRGHSAEDVLKGVGIIKNNGITAGLQFMTGYPDESVEDVEITIDSLKNLKPDFIRIYPFVPLEGSEMFEEISSGRKELIQKEEVMERTVSLFLEAMKLNIPVIRIGLPVSSSMPDIYPHNLSQVVVGRAIERLATEGETLFDLPSEWMTSFFTARKKFPQILVDK